MIHIVVFSPVLDRVLMEAGYQPVSGCIDSTSYYVSLDTLQILSLDDGWETYIYS